MRRRRPVMDQRLLRGQRRMIPGTLEGRSEQAQPKPQAPKGSVYNAPPDEVAEWSQAGAVSVVALADCPKHDVIRAFDTLLVTCTLATAGSTATVFSVYLDTTLVGTVTVASSSTRQPKTFNTVGASQGQALRVFPTTAGTGAKGAAAQTRSRG